MKVTSEKSNGYRICSLYSSIDELHELHSDELHCNSSMVIRENKDYKNSDRVAIGDTTPKFKFVMKKSPPKVVLVLDVSGSMNDDQKLIKLRQSCYTLVRFVLSECSEVGIVLFNTTAIISRPMTRVPRDPTAREYLANDLPRYAADEQHNKPLIFKGINKALDMLGDDVEGSHLIVVSDGKETEGPKIPNVTQRVLKSKVTVHSMAITEAAEFEMDGLSKLTNGKTYQFGPIDKMSYFSALRAFGESVEEF
ncbi:hypothetical protein CAPTEDRAFT_197077, partial [Capitella teleta]